jgi:hypothetical protein
MRMYIIFIPSFLSQFEYDQYRSVAKDGDKLFVDLISYEQSVITIKRDIESNGSFVVRGPIIISDMVRWLKSMGYENTGKNRALYYAEQAKTFE